MASAESTGGITPGTQAARELKAWLEPEINHLKAGQVALNTTVAMQNGRISALERLHAVEDGRRAARDSMGLTARTWVGLLLAMGSTAIAAVGLALAAVNGGM